LQVLPAEHATENECKEYEYYCQSFDQGLFAGLSEILQAPLAVAMGQLL
jgi:hypothetical protein